MYRWTNNQIYIYIYIYTGVKLGSSVSLSTVLQEDVDRARRKQMIALQHRLIEVSSGPEEPVQSVLAWRSSSAAGPTSSNDAAAGGKAPKAAATASEAVFSLNWSGQVKAWRSHIRTLTWNWKKGTWAWIALVRWCTSTTQRWDESEWKGQQYNTACACGCVERKRSTADQGRDLLLLGKWLNGMKRANSQV